MISLRQYRHPRASWWFAILAGVVWLTVFLAFGQQRGSVKEVYRKYAFDRVAEAATFWAIANDHYPEWLQKLHRFDDASIDAFLVRFCEVSEKFDLMPDGSRVKFAVPFVELGNRNMAFTVLPEEPYPDKILERQRKLMEALASGETPTEGLSNWASNRYRGGTSELPEWLLLYQGGDSGIRSWMEGQGRQLVRGGLIGNTLLMLGLLVGAAATARWFFRRSGNPSAVPISPILKQWNSAFVLRQFFVAELLGMGMVTLTAFVPFSRATADIQMALLHLVYLGFPALFLVFRLFPGPRVAWRLFFPSGKGWGPGRSIQFAMVFVFFFLSLVLVGTLLESFPFAVGDIINADYIDSKTRVVWVVIAATFVAPFCEEFLFRGCLFGGLQRSWGLWPAALFSSGLFAFFHGYSVIGLIATFLMGMSFCWLYRRSGTLWPAVIGHGVYNFIVVSQTLGWYSLH